MTLVSVVSRRHLPVLVKAPRPRTLTTVSMSPSLYQFRVSSVNAKRSTSEIVSIFLDQYSVALNFHTVAISLSGDAGCG